MSKYLIINADDFGLTERINQGILIAHQFGTVSSTSLMVNMLGFDHAVLLAKQTPSLGVGLHFNLSSGNPSSPAAFIPSLLRADGCFSGARQSWKEEEIEYELNQQYNKLVSAKVIPTHLDSHHHIHIEIPSVYTVMKKFSLQHALPLRRNPSASEFIDHRWTTDFLIMDTYNNDEGKVRLLTHIQTLGEGTTEIMCHPQISDQGTLNTELLVLTDTFIKEAIQMNNVQLIHFGQLPKDDPLVLAMHHPPIPVLLPEAPISSAVLAPSLHRHKNSRKQRLGRKRRSTLIKTRARKKKRNPHLSRIAAAKIRARALRRK